MFSPVWHVTTSELVSGSSTSHLVVHWKKLGSLRLPKADECDYTPFWLKGDEPCKGIMVRQDCSTFDYVELCKMCEGLWLKTSWLCAIAWPSVTLAKLAHLIVLTQPKINVTLNTWASRQIAPHFSVFASFSSSGSCIKWFITHKVFHTTHECVFWCDVETVAEGLWCNVISSRWPASVVILAKSLHHYAGLNCTRLTVPLKKYLV